jgi:hypothetical protein
LITLKFSEDNKIIMVSGTTYNEEFYELIIKDFGIGFSENELNKIGAHNSSIEKGTTRSGFRSFLSKIIINKFKGVLVLILEREEEPR